MAGDVQTQLLMSVFKDSIDFLQENLLCSSNWFIKETDLLKIKNKNYCFLFWIQHKAFPAVSRWQCNPKELLNKPQHCFPTVEYTTLNILCFDCFSTERERKNRVQTLILCNTRSAPSWETAFHQQPIDSTVVSVKVQPDTVQATSDLIRLSLMCNKCRQQQGKKHSHETLSWTHFIN